MNHNDEVSLMLAEAAQGMIDSHSEPPAWAEHWRGQDRPEGGWPCREPEIVIQLHPDGRRFAVYTEAIPLESLGTLTAKRASNVDFNEATQKWEVILTGETEPRFSDKSRAKCIRWEVNYLNGHLTETMEKHFPKAA